MEAVVKGGSANTRRGDQGLVRSESAGVRGFAEPDHELLVCLVSASCGDSTQATDRQRAIVCTDPDPESRVMVNHLPHLSIYLLLMLLAGTPGLTAQDVSQEKLVALRDKKMGSAFLRAAPWQTDFDQAKAAAKERGQLIFVYFTRSFAP